MKINASYFTNLMQIDENNQEKEFKLEENRVAEMFADGLKRIRKHKKVKLKDVSTATNIPVTTIVRYENAENIPSVIQALKLSYFYNIDLKEIFAIGFFDDVQGEIMIEEIEEQQKK